MNPPRIDPLLFRCMSSIFSRDMLNFFLETMFEPYAKQASHIRQQVFGITTNKDSLRVAKTDSVTLLGLDQSRFQGSQNLNLQAPSIQQSASS